MYFKNKSMKTCIFILYFNIYIYILLFFHSQLLNFTHYANCCGTTHSSKFFTVQVYEFLLLTQMKLNNDP